MPEGRDDSDESPNTLPESAIFPLWERFKSGDGAPCPRDGAPLALAVDAAAKSYRLVCTRCGVASPWFEASPNGIVMRGPAPTLVPQPGMSDD
jgi:hypothetical protein